MKYYNLVFLTDRYPESWPEGEEEEEEGEEKEEEEEEEFE